MNLWQLRTAEYSVSTFSHITRTQSRKQPVCMEVPVAFSKAPRNYLAVAAV